MYEIWYHRIDFDVIEQLKEVSLKDPEYNFLWWQTKKMQDFRKPTKYGIDDRKFFIFKGSVYVPNQVRFKQMLLDEFHRRPYATHPGYQKLFSPIKKIYFWLGMRKDIMTYLVTCL